MTQDRENQYSGAEVVAASGASQDVVDHGADRNLGIGEPMVVVITLDEEPKESDGNETYAAKLQTDEDASFGSATDVGESITILRTAAAGTRYVIPVPPDTKMERVSRLYYTLGGTNPSMTVTARMMPQRLIQNNVVYPKGYTIS